MKTYYTFDDVLLKPKFNSVGSRLHTNLSTKLSEHYSIKIPIVSTNMSTITEGNMMRLMSRIGGAGFLHRSLTVLEGREIIRDLKTAKQEIIVASVGLGPRELERAYEYVYYGANIILIDIAHAHSANMLKQIEKVLNLNTEVIVGNIATKEAAKDILSAGAHGLRAGIGRGSRCETIGVTGHGVPYLTMLTDIVEARNEYLQISGRYIPIIIDGGFRTSGEMVKALYFGADSICIGGILAGTKETPGKVFTIDGKKKKDFYGEASKQAQEFRGGLKEGTSSEGFSRPVPFIGSAKPILEQLLGGIRSGLTYSGASNIEELRKRGEAILLSQMALQEMYKNTHQLNDNI